MIKGEVLSALPLDLDAVPSTDDGVGQAEAGNGGDTSSRAAMESGGPTPRHPLK